jgi:hypothetical protein
MTVRPRTSKITELSKQGGSEQETALVTARGNLTSIVLPNMSGLNDPQSDAERVCTPSSIQQDIGLIVRTPRSVSRDLQSCRAPHKAPNLPLTHRLRSPLPHRSLRPPDYPYHLLPQSVLQNHQFLHQLYSRRKPLTSWISKAGNIPPSVKSSMLPLMYGYCVDGPAPMRLTDLFC